MPFSTITSWARLIWEGLRTYGVDADAVFREVGLDPGALNDPGARYPVASMTRLWGVARERSGDPCFGLTAAEQWHPTTWHGLGYAWLASTTLEEAMRRLVRYSAVISNAAEFRLLEVGGRFKLVLAVHRESGVEPVPAVMDAVAANVVHMSRLTYGDDFNPVSIELRHSGTGCRKRRREFFRCPIQYDAEEIAVEIERSVACKPLSTANADLAHANERVISDYLAELGGGGVAMRVRARLVDGLPSGDVTEKSVAESLNMSARTLQRRLSDENTTYKSVLEDTRRQLAERFIRDRTLTLNEITYLLGFSEISSFSRSFRRWTGMAPTVYRQAADQASGS